MSLFYLRDVYKRQVYGLEQARKDVSEYSQEAMDILSGMQEVTEPKASFLYHFVEYLIHRNK